MALLFRLGPICVALLCAGCAPPSTPGGALSREAAAAPPPEIVALRPLLAGLPEGRAEAATARALARAAALRDRAERLAAAGPERGAREAISSRRARLVEARRRLSD